MERGRIRWGTGRVVPFRPGGRTPGRLAARAAPRSEVWTTTGAAHPRSAAPFTGVQGGCGPGWNGTRGAGPPMPEAGSPHASWRWPYGRSCLNRRGGTPCAAHGVPPPRLPPPPDRRPGHCAPSARSARMARGSDPGRGGGCGDGARVRRTSTVPTLSGVPRDRGRNPIILMRPLLTCRGRVGLGRDPSQARPEHEAAADHPVTDAARVAPAQAAPRRPRPWNPRPRRSAGRQPPHRRRGR